MSPRNASHDVRIKVCRVPGDRMIADTLSVAVRPQPRIIGSGTLPAKTWDPVVRWIRLNEQAIVDYCDGKIDSLELAARLTKV